MAKKKIAAAAAVVALAAVAVVGTLAYFTDSKEVTNTFTVGDLTITLDEYQIKEFDQATNHFIADTTKARTEEGVDYGDFQKVAPGATIDKDPKVTLDAGSEDAFIAVIVDINKPITALVEPTYGYLALTDGFITGGIATEKTWGWDVDFEYGGDYSFVNADKSVYIVQYKQTDGQGALTGWKVVYYFTKQFAAEHAETLFTAINIPSDWDTEEMEELDGLTMDINAYAVQANGFDDVKDAMDAGYPSIFGSLS